MIRGFSSPTWRPVWFSQQSKAVTQLNYTENACKNDMMTIIDYQWLVSDSSPDSCSRALCLTGVSSVRNVVNLMQILRDADSASAGGDDIIFPSLWPHVLSYWFSPITPFDLVLHKHGANHFKLSGASLFKKKKKTHGFKLIFDLSFSFSY